MHAGQGKARQGNGDILFLILNVGCLSYGYSEIVDCSVMLLSCCLVSCGVVHYEALIFFYHTL